MQRNIRPSTSHHRRPRHRRMHLIAKNKSGNKKQLGKQQHTLDKTTEKRVQCAHIGRHFPNTQKQHRHKQQQRQDT